MQPPDDKVDLFRETNAGDPFDSFICFFICNFYFCKFIGGLVNLEEGFFVLCVYDAIWGTFGSGFFCFWDFYFVLFKILVELRWILRFLFSKCFGVLFWKFNLCLENWFLIWVDKTWDDTVEVTNIWEMFWWRIIDFAKCFCNTWNKGPWFCRYSWPYSRNLFPNNSIVFIFLDALGWSIMKAGEMGIFGLSPFPFLFFFSFSFYCLFYFWVLVVVYKHIWSLNIASNHSLFQQWE